MEHLLGWWRARTNRERGLLQAASLLILAVWVPAWAYFGALQFRADAAARLANARTIEAQVETIARASRSRPSVERAGDSLRARLLAAAQSEGLTPAAIEQAGSGGLRIVFQPTQSLAVYRWIDQVGRSGGVVTRSVIVRVANSDLVNAEFEVRETS